MILVFTGDGKGKTTAALGLALRAAGHDLPVLFLQFIKNGGNSGEIKAVKALPGVEIRALGLGFPPPPSGEGYARHVAAAAEGLRFAGEAIASGRYGLIVLDEACTAVALQLFDEKELCRAVAGASGSTVVVLTGRGATPELIDMADTVTCMQCRKHGYDAGRRAVAGVEF